MNMNRGVADCLDALRRYGVDQPIDVAVVLGTGLGSLTDMLENPIKIPFVQLPGFPVARVSGHGGNLVIGTQQGVHTAYMQGRSHYYEHGDSAIMAGALATLQAMGAKSLILTNSAGSCRRDMPPGQVVLVCDHINFSGRNPLIGCGGDHVFVPMVDAYDPALRGKFHKAAAQTGLNLPEGIYMWFSGPSFETPAEIRMARNLGADLVGMSSVPEVILARQLGLPVACLSMVTNYGAGFQAGAPTHDQTKDIALSGAGAMQRLFEAFFSLKDAA